MRWMWIDRIVELIPRERLVAVKNVSLAEEHLHDHFEADPESGRSATPVMPASLIVEGMAQTAGILVGHAGSFKEKVILAKIGRATLEREATPGCVLRYTAQMKSLDARGASTTGLVEIASPCGVFEEAGRIELIFSHLDRNIGGDVYPEHNFVFGDAFRDLIVNSGFELPA
ncbi:MAG: beta-hydroxyacyl-ACP dehydratase [Phycisphaerae bacterium]|nr:beta-hydroxyacyl-ACP dehydratase [Phycisphaerae bacterium]